MEYHHPVFNRITFNPDLCFGKPCIRGMRMPVSSILSYMSSGMTMDDIIQEWPMLEHDDIQQALAFAAQAMEERILPLEQTDTS